MKYKIVLLMSIVLFSGCGKIKSADDVDYTTMIPSLQYEKYVKVLLKETTPVYTLDEKDNLVPFGERTKGTIQEISLPYSTDLYRNKEGMLFFCYGNEEYIDNKWVDIYIPHYAIYNPYLETADGLIGITHGISYNDIAGTTIIYQVAEYRGATFPLYDFMVYDERSVYYSSLKVKEIEMKEINNDSTPEIILRGSYINNQWDYEVKGIESAEIWLNYRDNELHKIFTAYLSAGKEYHYSNTYSYQYLDEDNDGFREKIIMTVKSFRDKYQDDMNINTKYSDNRFGTEYVTNVYLWENGAYEKQKNKKE